MMTVARAAATLGQEEVANMDTNGISLEQWRAMSHEQRCEEFLRMTPEREVIVTRDLLQELGSPREWAELFIAASSWGQVADTPCTVDRAVALAKYLRDDACKDAVLERVRIAAWHADGRLPMMGKSEPQRRVELACQILSAYAMVASVSTPPAASMPKDQAADQSAESAGELPDLIAWRCEDHCRVFPTSQAGLAALMARPSYARYGVPLLHHGVDVPSDVLASMLSDGLKIGICGGGQVRDAIAAVNAWRCGGQQPWTPF
jgi:hypothetical protein